MKRDDFLLKQMSPSKGEQALVDLWNAFLMWEYAFKKEHGKQPTQEELSHYIVRKILR